MAKDLRVSYERAVSIPDLFEVVKEVVRRGLGRERAGLMLGLTDLGISSLGFIGAFFQVGGNAIIVNRQALDIVRARDPKLYKPYLFHILLHEYLHSVNILDEALTERTAADLSSGLLGENHPASVISREFSRLFREVIRPPYGYIPPSETSIDLISGFDRSSVTYIQ